MCIEHVSKRNGKCCDGKLVGEHNSGCESEHVGKCDGKRDR